jgi:hypothetical protein
MRHDAMRTKYVVTRADTMGTGIMASEAKHDPATGTITYSGEAPDVITGKYKPVRRVDKRVSADEWI